MKCNSAAVAIQPGAGKRGEEHGTAGAFGRLPELARKRQRLLEKLTFSQ